MASRHAGEGAHTLNKKKRHKRKTAPVTFINRIQLLLQVVRALGLPSPYAPNQDPLIDLHILASVRL